MTVLRKILTIFLINFILFFILGWGLTGEFSHGFNWGKNGTFILGVIFVFCLMPVFFGRKLGESV